MGALVGPESFSEVRYLAHRKQVRAMARIPELAKEFEAAFGRNSGGLLRTYRTGGASTVVIAMGSVMGTIEDAIDEMRDDEYSIGAVILTTFRPFPYAALREALRGASNVIVLDKSLTAGMGGPLAADVRLALAGNSQKVYSAIAGLGGRPITKASLRSYFERASLGELPDMTFLDLNWDLVNEALAMQP